MAGVRSRRRHVTGNEVVNNLNMMITELIKENRKLRRQVEKLSTGVTGATSRVVERGLRGIQRRLQKAVADGAATGRRRRATSTTAASRRGQKATTTRVRKPVSPEVAQKRREALARARAARVTKREAALATSEPGASE